MSTQTTDFWKLFKPSHCSLKLTGTSKDDVLAELVQHLVKTGALEESLSDDALRALSDREQLASTGVGMNVAIPHVKLEGLDSVVLALCVHKDGVDWNALDGDPVHLFFTVLRPEEAGDQYDPERHLEMMRWVSRLARDGDFRRFALTVENRTQLVDLLKEMSGV